MSTACVVLAAGEGSRFGGAKQLAELDGVPMLEHVLRTVASAPVDRTVVVLGADAEGILAGVQLHGAEHTLCESWDDGQAASLACGLGEVDEADRVLIVLGDQPGITAESMRRVLAALEAGATAARATYESKPGHPVGVDRSLFEEMRDVTGDSGGRAVLARAGAVDVPCDDLGGGEDVDTPEQLERLRAEGGAGR